MCLYHLLPLTPLLILLIISLVFRTAEVTGVGIWVFVGWYLFD